MSRQLKDCFFSMAHGLLVTPLFQGREESKQVDQAMLVDKGRFAVRNSQQKHLRADFPLGNTEH